MQLDSFAWQQAPSLLTWRCPHADSCLGRSNSTAYLLLPSDTTKPCSGCVSTSSMLPGVAFKNSVHVLKEKVSFFLDVCMTLSAGYVGRCLLVTKPFALSCMGLAKHADQDFAAIRLQKHQGSGLSDNESDGYRLYRRAGRRSAFRHAGVERSTPTRANTITFASATLAQATLRHWAGQGQVVHVGRSLFCSGAAAEMLVSHCGVTVPAGSHACPLHGQTLAAHVLSLPDLLPLSLRRCIPCDACAGWRK